ncbi:uncharacterized protein LOC124451295 [Xenia sp. Carnegie-2017]|uniref:uncharacterized protein LOC124451295 n=1 Tax=Xenia sp. Carnegie-2017 TaxID=2897299 RepID=UPI001F049E70|nr:uncharacterized protein LOC124451295 [Xenia sp. Carnegie-2017]
MEYDAVMREQLQLGVVEKGNHKAKRKEFYLPHKAVVMKDAETYETTNCLLSVIARNRFHAVAIAGDLKKAFLQVRVRESEQDSLRFHWIKNVNSSEIEVLRFIQVVFGLTPSPFFLNRVLQEHLNILENRYPEVVEDIRKSLYVDNLISGASVTE